MREILHPAALRKGFFNHRQIYYISILVNLYGMLYNAHEVIVMFTTTSKESSIKYTTVLPKACIDEMKYLAAKKIVPSVSQGIRLAIENFITTQKQHEYANSLIEAANDNAFIKRTMDTQNDFAVVDGEGFESW